MKVKVDHHDAELMLRLYDMRREEKLRRAREWFIGQFQLKSADEYQKKYPPGSEENTFTRMVVTYWEMVGSIVNSGLIEQDFFFQNTGEFFIIWEKIKPLVPGIRESFKNPLLWKNLEKLSENYEEWMNKRAPGAIGATRERLAAAEKK
ncbi:MAG: hypothetical protein EPN47_07875 [Acidobacteria bacterium]|nr:MAG: hypothetical protein EPN47_07875 [Acidobacteriota bacterium]